MNALDAMIHDAIRWHGIVTTKQAARALLARGPCYRQANLAPLVGVMWGAQPADMDLRIRRAINAETARATAGHYLFDRNRLIALRAHRLARRYGRRYEEQGR